MSQEVAQSSLLLKYNQRKYDVLKEQIDELKKMKKMRKLL